MKRLSILLLIVLTLTSYKKKTLPDTNESGKRPTSSKDANLVQLAAAFKATLNADQLAILEIPLNKLNASHWSNLPMTFVKRNGLEFSTLSKTQLDAAKAVIRAASGKTANEGYEEFMLVGAADEQLSRHNKDWFSAGKYFIAFLGTPSDNGSWMLQFGGHHYAQNIMFSDGVEVSATPSHQGVEPKTWTENGKTYAPLAEEHDGMAAMLAALSPEKLAAAKLATTFSDVMLGPGKDGQFPTTKLGLKVSSLSAAEQKKVLAAMMPWINDFDAKLSAKLVKMYTAELSDTYVSFAGNADAKPGEAGSFLKTNADYVRIDGPGVWIEFVCQNGVVFKDQIHYHAVFRDHQRDYKGL
jgi:hypothetical protein